MIKIIDIQNFQGYTRARISLKRFNLIIGKSSSGKSSIFRALKFLFYGDWDNTYYNIPGKSAGVGITLSNGVRILRIKDQKINKALIETQTAKDKYESFGDIIPNIDSFINVKEIEINNKKININFSSQDDQIFMLSESKPTKAAWLGRLYGADLINNAIKNIIKDKNKKEKELEIIKDDIKELNETLKQYENLDRQKEILKECSLIEEELNKLKDIKLKKEKLDSINESLKNKDQIMNYDVGYIKTLILEITELKKIKSQKEKILKDKEYINKNKSALLIDTKKIKSDILKLNELKGIKHNLINNEELLTKSRNDLSEVILKLETVNKMTKDKIFSNNKCPICESRIESNNQIDIKSLLSRIKNIL